MNHPNFNKKARFGWIMFDWANSVYALTITTAIFPVYFHAMAKQIAVNKDMVRPATPTQEAIPAIVEFMGFEINSVSLISLCVSVAFLLIVLTSPFLGALADYGGHKKKFMIFFTLIGSIACMAMFWFTKETFYLGVWMFILATFGYAGGIIFNDAFLPEIAKPNEYDKMSAWGYSAGYVGSVILLAANLAMVLGAEDIFGANGRTKDELELLGSRWSLLSTGIWWLLFAMIPFITLKDVKPAHEVKNLFKKGYEELQKVIRQLKGNKVLTRYLIGFFFFQMGVQTVMYMAATFGTVELGLKAEQMIGSMFIIHLVAIPGSFLFAWSSRRFGNLRTLIWGILFWITTCIIAYFVRDANGFYVVGTMFGLVMGGTQSLSRSTYSKLLPETTDTASFFSFYAIMDKVAIIGGTFSFAAFSYFVDLRTSVIALILFFLIGLAILLYLRKNFQLTL